MPDDAPGPLQKATTPDPSPIGSPQLLQYDTRALPFSRRQVNVFLLLLLINTIVFTCHVALPGLFPALKQSWLEHRDRLAAEKAFQNQQAARQALVDACANYTLPADRIVYAEPPADSAKLLASDATARYALTNAGGGGGGGLFGGGGRTPNPLFDRLTAAGWQPPAALGRPRPLETLIDQTFQPGSNERGWLSKDETLIFLHARSTPSGTPCIVWVCIGGELDSATQQTGDTPDNGSSHLITCDRHLAAHVFNADMTNASQATLHITAPEAQRTQVTFKENTPPIISPHGQWRIYAGQPDPKDPTHFTIAYDVDNKPGVIDGRLNDGLRVVLTPRTGHLLAWTTETNYAWDLTPSTTKPSP